MRVSVALCTYNGERFLNEQLASLAGQSRLPDELVVFDDASTDSTLSVINEFAASAPFRVFVTVNPARIGVVRNFEQAIAACHGDIIFLCDQDDVWFPEKIEEMAADFDDDLAMLFSDAEYRDGSLWNHIGFTHADRRDLLDTLSQRNVVTGATMAFRASHRDTILPIPELEGMLHDEWIALVLAASAKVALIDEALIEYREHEQQQAGGGRAVGGLGRWVGAARGTRRGEYYANRAERLRLVTSRVKNPSLEERARHFEFRSKLPESRLARVGPVLSHVGDYLRYSNSVWSIARDLFWRD